jgi:rod shape-determining protein MreC
VLLLVLLVLSIVLITIDFRSGGGGPLADVKDISSSIVAPIQKGITAVTRPIGDFFSSIGDLAGLRSENARLRSAVQELHQQTNEFQALQEENFRLHQMLDLRENWTTMKTKTAQVIGVPPDNYKWAVFIDKGRSDRIHRDMAVIDPEGLVGKIVQVGPHQATVLLLIDPQAAAAAKISGGSQTVNGLIQGNGGSQDLSMTGVPGNADVTPGQKVQTDYYNGGIFPPGIPIGTIVGAGGDERALEQSIQVEPAVDFSNLDFVQILMGTGGHPLRHGRK